MDRILIATFDAEKKAYEAHHALQALHAEGSLTVWGSGVLRRAPDGKVSIVKRDDEGPLGAGLGALAGGLVGLFGGPVGAVVGATVGGAVGGVGDLVRLGVSREFLTAVEQNLTPGSFALIAEISEEWQVPLDTRMEALGAKVVREDRITLEADLLEKRVAARKAHLAELRAEHVARRNDQAHERAGAKAEEMLERLVKDVEYERRLLEYAAERAGRELETAKQELEAKVDALLAQASGARNDVRERIEQRIAAARGEFKEREGKLTRARELTREALQPERQA